MVSYDLIGSIAIMKFYKDMKESEKKKAANKLLEIKNIKTVLEKSDKVRGRLRTMKTKFLAGANTKEAVHKENNCRFKLNVETCYFSPRLAEERKEIASTITKKDRVLVMFSGVGPFAVVAAKKAREVVAIELSKECNKYAKENVKLNKLYNLKLIQGDVKKKATKELGKFDIIVMPRPNLKESFLKEAFFLNKKGTKIYYYGFCTEDKIDKLVEGIIEESKKAKKKIKILKIKKAGDIAPYKYRYRIDLKVI